MKIEMHLQETVTLEDFAKRHDLTMAVYERNPVEIPFNNLKKYFCYFKYLEILEGPILRSTSGDGDTINEAIEEYCKELSNKKIVIKATDPKSRKVLTTPTITPHWEQ